MKNVLALSKRKLLVWALAIPMMASAQVSDNTYMFLRGDGTEAKPYIIDSYESLVEFRELVALTPLDVRNRNVLVKADIDLGADPNWAPIRYYDSSSATDKWFFKGAVDGQGHTISNMTIDKRIDAIRPDDVYLGFFGRTNADNTSLKNLNLTNVKINVSLEAEPQNQLDVNVGALVGYDGCLIKNVNVDGDITIKDESSSTECSRHINVGGVVGAMSSLNSEQEVPNQLNADINISSNALGSRIGGIVGYAEAVTLQECTSSGMLTGRLVEPETSNTAYTWDISIGGICGYADNNDYRFKYNALCSVCRIYGGNWTGGLFGYMYASFQPMGSFVYLENSYAAGAVSDAYNNSGGLVGFIGKYTGTNVETNFIFKNCYYAGTLTMLRSQDGKSMVGNYQGDQSLTKYTFTNCFYDKRLMTDNTDYQTLLGVGTPEDMKKRIYAYDTSETIGENPPFNILSDDNDQYWTFEANRYPQLNSIKDTPVSILAATPIFFKENETAERVYLGVNLSECKLNGEAAVWSAPVGNGSVAGLRLMSDAVGYEILTLTAGTCAKRLNLYMANSDDEWEGEAHIPTGDKSDVFMGKGVARNPYIIMNAGQLAYAVKNNSKNEYYQIGHDIIINRDLLSDTETAIPWIDTKKAAYSWKADLDGNGYLVHGMYLPLQSDRDISHQHGLLGSIAADGHVANLGVVETVITDDFSSISDAESYVGSIAGTIETGGVLENCFTSGYIMLKAQQGLLYAGGICGMALGTISDCLNATSVMCTERDVMRNQMGGIAGKADNAQFIRCLNIGRVSYFDGLTDKWQGGLCPGNGYTKTDCYDDMMMSSCDAGDAGKTTAQLTGGSIFSGESRWTAATDCYPILKDFAETDYMKLLAQPITFNEGDCSAKIKNILELPLGKISWTMPESEGCVNLYADYGLAEPKAQGTTCLSASMNAANGRSKSCNLLFISVPEDYVEGIQFVDENARKACVEAFGTDGVITLQQAMSVTDFAPFVQHQSSSDIVEFPEMRYFTGITRLTNQLSSCSSLEKVELPLGLKSIAAEAFDGCNSLESVSLPVNLTKVEPYAFRKSSLKQILVNKGNDHFLSRDGVLFDEKEYIVAYPPKKEGESYMYTNPINGILTGAFQDIDQLQTLYIGDDEGNYIDLKKNAIPSDMMVYVNDATDNSDYIDTYRYDESRDWQYLDENDNLARYFPLRVTSAKYATMCIYFNTELPKGLKAYYCFQRDDAEAGVARFYELGSMVHAGVPVLIHGDKAAVYPLYESEEDMEEPDDRCEFFEGSGEHGLIVGDQSAGSGTTQGSILTLGHNSKGELGFFFFKSSTNKIPAYRAYLMVETLSANGYGISIEDASGITAPRSEVMQAASSVIYDLSGRKVADSSDLRKLPKGIYIQNGKKICVQ